MKKTSFVKSKRNKKNFSFFIRFFTLFVLVGAIVTSSVFGFQYLDNNGNSSIEFAGGYKANLKYDGIYENSSKTDEVVKILEKRVNSSNVEKGNNTGNYYSVSISKSDNVNLSVFVNNLNRRGYVYLLDGQGHDLLANDYDEKQDKWTQKQERITTSQAFSKIEESTNLNTGSPQIVFNTSSDLMPTIQEVIKKQESLYFYSDIGGLLNYLRNTWSGLQDLVKFIDKETNPDKKEGLMTLLANEVPAFSDATGQKMYQAVKDQNPQLIDLLDQSKNGVFMIRWIYSDAIDSNFPLSVDTNDKDNVFDPEKPFDKTSAKKSSPVNAWLPYIKDLIILSDVSRVLQTQIINYKYAPYYIGSISGRSIDGSKITVNDDSFNKDKVQQIVSILNIGKQKNNFTVLSVLSIDPTLGAQSLKVAMIGLLVSLILLNLILIFNYRLLGGVAALIILIFLVFTLVSFTFLNNIVGPETGIALIVGFALLLDTIVSLFNRFQKEYRSGKNIYDAFKSANKKSLVSSFDSSFIVLVVSLAIFWFGSKSIKNFAIMTSIATFGVVVFGILLLRFVLYLLLKQLEKNPALFSLEQDKVALAQKKAANKLAKNTKAKFSSIKNKVVSTLKVDKTKESTIASQVIKTDKLNFWHKSTKWVVAVFGVILLSSGVVFLATGSNFGQGFDSSLDFTGQAIAQESTSGSSLDLWKQAEKLREITIDVLQKENKTYNKVYASLILDSLGQRKNVIQIIIQTNINTSQADDFLKVLNYKITELSWSNYTINKSLSGNELFKNMLLVFAISLIIIFVYIMIRFQFTFSIPLMISLALVIFVTLAMLALTYITISTMTIGVVLALIFLALINSIIIFDNFKEIKLINFKKRNELSKEEIIVISNEGIKKSLSRTLVVNSIIILTALIVLCFLPSFWAVSLAIIIGVIVVFFVTHFVGPWLWVFFEQRRIKYFKKRAEKLQKHFVGPDEYIIEGIND